MKGGEKTNVMRVLEAKKIAYTSHSYEPDAGLSGEEIAGLLGEDPERVFKTLVTKGKSGQHYVFVIPVAKELDLKAAAKAVGEKSVEMIHVKELQPLTGYVRGGCTAIGMKKTFPTVIDSSAKDLPKIIVSGGKIGIQLELSPADLARAAGAEYADVIG